MKVIQKLKTLAAYDLAARGQNLQLKILSFKSSFLGKSDYIQQACLQKVWMSMLEQGRGAKRLYRFRIYGIFRVTRFKIPLQNTGWRSFTR